MLTQMPTMTNFLIVPTDHIQRLCESEKDLKHFFYQFPFEAIIEFALNLENHKDFSTAVWYEIEKKLTDDEIQILNLESVEIAIETIIEKFYEELRLMPVDYDTVYSVVMWYPDAVCLRRIRQDNLILKLREQNEHHYPASEF